MEHRKPLPPVQPQPQRQGALVEQLRDLVQVANRLGMYDAADYLTKKLEKC